MNTQYLKLILPFLTILTTVFSTETMAQPPEPEEGSRWILNDPLSDEFNGTSLDHAKWWDYAPNWVGRPPGIFLPSQVSVQDGCLVLRNKKLDEPMIVNGKTFTIAGGAVNTRSNDAFYGYYECSMKASRIRMSSTFWMSGSGAPGPDPCTGDRYSLELDIQECVGGFSGKMTNSMNSNSHYKYTDCNGNVETFSSGNTIEGDRNLADTFFVYGAHWIDANKAELYFNGKYGGRINFKTNASDKPFDRPMHINMVTETYDWVRPLPTDEDLADSSINATYIDWVRSYLKVPVDFMPDADALVKNGGFETGDFSNWSGWGGNPLEVVSGNQYSGDYCVHIKGPGAPEYEVALKRNTAYVLSCYGKVVSGTIMFGIKDINDQYYGTVDFTGSGYEKKTIEFTTGMTAGLKFYFYAPGSGDEGYADDFELVEKFPEEEEVEETVMFNETIRLSETPNEKTAGSELDFLITYMANADREINLQLLNPAGILVGQKKYSALAGYGKKRFSFSLDSTPTPGYGYRLLADIRPADSTFADTFRTAEYTFDLLLPSEVTLNVLDKRDDLPLSGALVSIGDSTKSTDAEGRVTFFSVSPGSMPVQVERAGYEIYFSDACTVRSDTSLDLRLTPESYILRLYVLNGFTGEALPGASISIGGITSQTDFEGKTVRSIYAGNYPAEISMERFAGESPVFNVSGDTSIYISLKQVIANVRFVVKKDSASLYRATVSLGGEDVSTSPVGLASFPDVKTDTLLAYSVEYMSSILLEDSLTVQTDTTLWIYYNTPAHTLSTYNNDLSVWPNPASTTLNISGLSEEIAYNISDINGRVLLTGRVEINGNIDVSILENGIYLLKAGNSMAFRITINRK